jgi:hypothetical protein
MKKIDLNESEPTFSLKLHNVLDLSYRNHLTNNIYLNMYYQEEQWISYDRVKHF